MGWALCYPVCKPSIRVEMRQLATQYDRRVAVVNTLCLLTGAQETCHWRAPKQHRVAAGLVLGAKYCVQMGWTCCMAVSAAAYGTEGGWGGWWPATEIQQRCWSGLRKRL
jgi:hypothetical protein